MINGTAWPGPVRRIRLLALCLLSLLLAAGCAAKQPAPSAPKPRETIVLLPDEQGKTGAIVVSNPKGEHTLSKPREALTIDAAGTPGKPFVMPEKQVDALVGPARAALPPRPVRIVLYFRHDSTELTEESRAKLPEALGIIRERQPVDISVVGHTDTVGEKEYNYRLSCRRARAVADMLAAHGVPKPIMAVTSHGKDNPLVPTADQVPEPRNRRVEITVR